MPARVMLRLIAALPTPVDGTASRMRRCTHESPAESPPQPSVVPQLDSVAFACRRTQHLVDSLTLADAAAGWRVLLYVRGGRATPPASRSTIHPPRVVVLTLRGPLLYFVMTVAPMGARQDSKEVKEMERESLRLAAWQVAYMAKLPRN